jgi:hypothetical protein
LSRGVSLRRFQSSQGFAFTSCFHSTSNCQLD